MNCHLCLIQRIRVMNCHLCLIQRICVMNCHTTCTNRTTPATTLIQTEGMQVLLPRGTLTKHYTLLSTVRHTSYTPNYQPISKLLGKDENAALANLGMRTVATPADGHCLLHAFIRTEEIKYGNSDPCNERENKLLELIKSMKKVFLLSKDIYSEFTTNYYYYY